ncbi:hypothetical protein MTO96_003700 [Rhipicephalus appendiculatus]
MEAGPLQGRRGARAGCGSRADFAHLYGRPPELLITPPGSVHDECHRKSTTTSSAGRDKIRQPPLVKSVNAYRARPKVGPEEREKKQRQKAWWGDSAMEFGTAYAELADNAENKQKNDRKRASRALETHVRLG